MAGEEKVADVDTSTKESGFISKLRKSDILARHYTSSNGCLQADDKVYVMSLMSRMGSEETQEEQPESESHWPDDWTQKVGNAKVFKVKVKPNVVGKGGFGSIYRCNLQEQATSSSTSSQNICLKLSVHYDFRDRPDSDINKHIIREIENFELLSKDEPHKNIIKFLFACSLDNNRICIGMKYFPGNDLSKTIHQYVRNRKRFPIDHINIIMKGVISAIMHLQKYSMVHCDIKPHNVLFNSSNEKVKLIDFGCAVVLGQNVSKDMGGGTSLYMAPEMLRKSRAMYEDCTDVYCVGALMYRLVTFRRPWEDHPKVCKVLQDQQGHRKHKLLGEAILEVMSERKENNLTLLQQTLMEPRTEHRFLYPDQCDLINEMLNIEPKKRPNCKAILSAIYTFLACKLQRFTSRSLSQQTDGGVNRISTVQDEDAGVCDQQMPFLQHLLSATTASTASKATSVPSRILSEDRRLDAEDNNTRSTYSKGSNLSEYDRAAEIYKAKRGQCTDQSGLLDEMHESPDQTLVNSALLEGATQTVQQSTNSPNSQQRTAAITSPDSQFNYCPEEDDSSDYYDETGGSYLSMTESVQSLESCPLFTMPPSTPCVQLTYTEAGSEQHQQDNMDFDNEVVELCTQHEQDMSF